MRNYSEKERAWLWLNDSIGSNVRLADLLVSNNGGLLSLYDSAANGRRINFPEKTSPQIKRALAERCSAAYIDGLVENMEKKSVYAVTRDSDDYPMLLREIYDPPTVLYVKGRLQSKMDLPIAVIGSRSCTEYGKEMAIFFGKRLAEHGCCVVSGLAEGCDSYAAQGALSVRSAEYPSIAVLGSGVDVVYPRSSAPLYEQMIERGAVISEFKPGRQPTRDSFPQRNRIISGLSKGVLVIEAAAKSGTSITVDFAHEQGRDVFAIPGRITDLKSAGTNSLIKSGAAKSVFDVDDILYEYGIFVESDVSPIRTCDLSKLSYEQKKIYKELLNGEKSIDALCEITGLSVSDLNTHLTEMELSGIIRQLSNGEYAV